MRRASLPHRPHRAWAHVGLLLALALGDRRLASAAASITPAQMQALATSAGEAAKKALERVQPTLDGEKEDTHLKNLAQTAVKGAKDWQAAASAWKTAADAWAANAADGAKEKSATDGKTETEAAQSVFDTADAALKAESPEQMKADADAAVKAETKAVEAAKDQPEVVRSAATIAKSLAEAWQGAVSKWIEARKAGKGVKDAEDLAIKARDAYAPAKTVRETEVARVKAFQEPGFNTEHFFVHSGVVSLAPFAIKTLPGSSPDANGQGEQKDERFYLDGADVSTRAYLEARYRYRLGWNRARLTMAEIGEKSLESQLKLADVDVDEGKLATALKRVTKGKTAARELGLEFGRTVDAADTFLRAGGGAEQPLEDSGPRSDAEGSEASRARNRAQPSPSSVPVSEQWRAFCLDGDIASVETWRLAPLVSCFFPSDYDLRFGVTFNSQDKTTASTVVGSGDVNGSAAVGWPLLHTDHLLPIKNKDEQYSRMSTALNAEILYEAVTDRGVQDIHERFVVGGAFIVGLLLDPMPLPSLDQPKTYKPRVYEIAMRFGWTRASIPDLADEPVVLDAGKKRPAIVNDDGLPGFETGTGVSMDMEVQAPFGSQGYLVLGSSLLLGSGLDPNPWNLRLGLTVPLGQIADLFADTLTRPLKQ